MISIQYLKAHVQCREKGLVVQVMTLPAKNFGRALQPESWVFFKSNGICCCCRGRGCPHHRHHHHRRRHRRLRRRLRRHVAAFFWFVLLFFSSFAFAFIFCWILDSCRSVVKLRKRLELGTFLEATHRGQGICADCCGWPQWWALPWVKQVPCCLLILLRLRLFENRSNHCWGWSFCSVLESSLFPAYLVAEAILFRHVMKHKWQRNKDWGGLPANARQWYKLSKMSIWLWLKETIEDSVQCRTKHGKSRRYKQTHLQVRSSRFLNSPRS